MPFCVGMLFCVGVPIGINESFPKRGGFHSIYPNTAYGRNKTYILFIGSTVSYNDMRRDTAMSRPGRVQFVNF